MWAWLVSRPPNLNPPIFLFTLVGANLPNLMPAKFSGYTVYSALVLDLLHLAIRLSQMTTPFHVFHYIYAIVNTTSNLVATWYKDTENKRSRDDP